MVEYYLQATQDRSNRSGNLIDLLNEVIDKTKEECANETKVVIKDFSSNGRN